MSRFVLTPAAQDDIVRILTYIELESQPASTRVLDALEKAMQRLADHPEIGHARPDLTRHDVRFWSVFSYLVIYRSNTVPLEIIRVLHGKRNIRRVMEE